MLCISTNESLLHTYSSRKDSILQLQIERHIETQCGQVSAHCLKSHNCRSTSGALFLSPYFIPSAALGQEDHQDALTGSLSGGFVLSEDQIATGG